jgi:hypothetical protein
VSIAGAKSPIASKRDRVTVHNPEAGHHDPALAAFLGLIGKDFTASRDVGDRSGTGSSKGFAQVCVRIYED